MSFHTVISLPFSSPGLVRFVLGNPDYKKYGYLWGFDGRVHYCFLNPERVHYENWKKEFWWRYLGWVAINVLAALAAAFASPALAIVTLLAIPTLPAALLSHYRRSAKAQDAAVVTNGPQMVYPGGITTAKMVGLPALGAIAVGIITSLATALGALPAAGAAGGIAISGVTLSPVFLGLLAGIGTGINAFALILFIAGYYSKPYGAVVSPVPDINENQPATPGTYYLGRRGIPITTYRIGPGNPVGMVWGCGGLTCMILNRISAANLWGSVQSTYGDLFLPPPTGLLHPPNDFVVWGLIELGPGSVPLASVTVAPQDTGPRPEYPQATIDPENWAAGMIVVAGAEPWTDADTKSLSVHGVVHAVATDGHLSPLLGSGDELVMETNMFLDPIQRYGLKSVPQ
jgi:hypothetical protein